MQLYVTVRGQAALALWLFSPPSKRSAHERLFAAYPRGTIPNYILKKAEYSQAEIAELLARDKSTISRELRRNRGQKGYRPQQAHNLVLQRRYDKAQPRIGNQVWQLVEVLIREEWSPEQIVGRVEMEQGVSISHEWIYQYIYADKHSGGDLYRCLRCQKVRRKRFNRPNQLV